MHQVTIGDKYQVTIPKEIREKLGIKPGQRVLVTASGGGITIQPEPGGGSDDRLTQITHHVSRSPDTWNRTPGT